MRLLIRVGAVAQRADHDVLADVRRGVELAGRQRAHLRHQVAFARVGVGGQEVRQLHEVAVGVEDHPFARICHGEAFRPKFRRI